VRKRRIVGIFLAVLAIVGALLALDVYLFLRPAQVEALIRTLLAEAFARPFRLREVSVSLVHGVKIRGLEVMGAGDEPDLRVEEASVAVDWRRLALREVRVVHPEIRILCDREGRFSVTTLFRKELFEPSKTAVELPTLGILIEGARVHFRDESQPPVLHEMDLADINMDIALDRERGVDLHGSIGLPFAKSFTFAASATPQDGIFDVVLEGQKIRVGQDLRPYIPPSPRKVFDMLRPEGVGDVEMHVSNRGRPKVEFWGEVKAHEGSVCAQPFPYRAYNSSGTIRIENNHIMLRGVQGGQKGGTYGCDGDVYAMPKGVDDRIDLRIWAKNMPLDDDLANAMPPNVGAIYRRFSPSGRGDATIHVFGNAKPPGVPDDMHWDIVGELRDGMARFDALPVPVHALGGRFEVHDTRFVMDRLTGTALEGRLDVAGYASPEQVDVHVDGAALQASPALREHLPESAHAPFDAVSPEGPVNLDLAVRGEQDASGGMEPTFAARITPAPGLTLRWDELPLQLEARGGEVVITPEGGDIRAFTAGRGPLTVTVSGAVGADDRGRPVALDIDAVGLALDDPLRRALRGSAREWVDRAGLEAGRVPRMHVAARKPAFEAAVDVSGSADFDGLRVRPPRFPYLVEDVHGALAFSRRGVDVTRLEGRAGDATVAAGGLVSFVPGRPSTAGAMIRGLAIDRALRDALEAAGVRIFSQVDLAGTADVAVVLEGSGDAIAPVAEARLRDASLLLAAFPFRLTRVEADLSYAAGRLALDRLEGLMGDARVEAHGDVAPLGSPPGGPPPVGRVAVTARDLPLDRRLRDALPAALRSAYAGADLDGKATIRANLVLDPRLAPERFLYNGEAVLDGLRCDVGVILKDVRGRVAFEGETPLAAPERTRLAGGLALERVVWQNQAVTEVTGRWRVGGGLADFGELHGRLLGGLVRGEAYAFYEPPLLYGAGFRLLGGRVERWAAERYSGKKKASGRVDALLTVAGEAAAGPGGKGTLHGDGQLSIRHADLWELPAVARLLNVLSFEAPQKAVFDDAEFAMRLDGSRTIIDRAEMSSSAISFVGRGTMAEGKLDVHLTHELGRPWIASLPVVGPLWDWLKGNLVEIEVTGPLDDPDIQVIPVRAVTDPMRWLFGDRGEDGPRTKKRLEE
jgi:hypothetical protein